jgi:autotransporter passenger strand-loop-strand repeat protein
MTIVSNTILSSGQHLDVTSPTSAYYTTAFAGSYQRVYGGGYAYETYVSGGAEYVSSGGVD